MNLLKTIRDWLRCEAEFMSEKQIVDDLIKRMSDADVRSYLMVQYEDLIRSHHGTGRAIRNHYRLWDESNPYVNLDESGHPDHPDQMSMRIIRTIWERAVDVAVARDIPFPTEEEIEAYARGS